MSATNIRHCRRCAKRVQRASSQWMTLLLVFSLPLLLGAEAEEAAEKIPAPTLAKLYMALLAIVILGLGLMLAIVLGGRMVRKMGQTSETTALHKDRWYSKPLVSEELEEEEDD